MSTQSDGRSRARFWSLASALAAAAAMATACMSSAGAEQQALGDEALIARAEEALQGRLAGRVPFPAFLAAIRPLATVDDKAKASDILARGIDIETVALREARGDDLKDVSFRVRFPCVHVLIEIGEPAVGELIRELKEPASERRRMLAHYALFWILGRSRMIDLLQDEGRKATDPEHIWNLDLDLAILEAKPVAP